MLNDEYRDVFDEVWEMTADDKKSLLFFLIGYCNRTEVLTAIEYVKKRRK